MVAWERESKREALGAHYGGKANTAVVKKQGTQKAGVLCYGY